MRPELAVADGRSSKLGLAISPISQSRSVTPAAIAGVVRNVLWMRTKL
jgi:hypothetical protein